MQCACNWNQTFIFFGLSICNNIQAILVNRCILFSKMQEYDLLMTFLMKKYITEYIYLQCTHPDSPALQLLLELLQHTLRVLLLEQLQHTLKVPSQGSQLLPTCSRHSGTVLYHGMVCLGPQWTANICKVC